MGVPQDAFQNLKKKRCVGGKIFPVGGGIKGADLGKFVKKCNL